MCSKWFLFAIVLLFAVPGLSQAADYKIDWYSINSGGGLVTGGAFRVNSSIGQPAAGSTQSTSFLHFVGFWADGVPAPTIVANISNAKKLADGTFVSISGKIATSASGDFADFFFVEESGRSSGIRVAASP
jgi:uncharacterized protein YdeI (BOF family)